MTTTVRWLVAIAIAAFVAFLAMGAPATLVAARLAAADPALTLTGVSGTAWRGHADRVRYGEVAVGTLDWRLAGARLFIAQGALHLALVGPDLRLSLDAQHSLFGGRTRIADAVGTLPLALLAEVSGARGPLDARVELEGVAFTLDGETVEHAEGRVRLRDTVALAPQRYPLGEYLLELSALDGWLVATVVEADGPLALTGLVRIRGDGRWEMDARARATQADSELALVLRLLGEPDAEGYRPLRLSGAL